MQSKLWIKIRFLIIIFFLLIQGGIEEIPPHHICQIYHFLSQQDDCTPPKCGELSEYIDSAHTEVEDPSLWCMNGLNMYGRYGHDTKHYCPLSTYFYYCLHSVDFLDPPLQVRIKVKATTRDIGQSLPEQIVIQGSPDEMWYIEERESK